MNNPKCGIVHYWFFWDSEKPTSKWKNKINKKDDKINI